MHSRRVVLELQVGEILELGELDDRGKRRRASAGDRPSRVALTMTLSRGGKLGMESDPELDERRDATHHGDAPTIRRVDTGQALEKSALPGTVRPDDAEELAPPHLERDISQRVESANPGRSSWGEHELL